MLTSYCSSTAYDTEKYKKLTIATNAELAVVIIVGILISMIYTLVIMPIGFELVNRAKQSKRRCNMNSTQNNTKTIQRITLVGAGINIILSAAKILVGIFAYSQALIADGIHSLSDLVSDAAILIGSKFWSDEPDEKHPYGHGRIETLVSLGIGVALAVVAFGIIIESIVSMSEPHTTAPGWLAFVVAIISIISKEFLYKLTVRAGKKVNSRALIANAWHHRTDSFSSIPVAIAVVGTQIFPEFVYLDHIAAILVSIMLLKASWEISRPCLAELMEAQSNQQINDKLLIFMLQHQKIHEFHKTRVHRVGNMNFVETHMLVDGNMTVSESHDITEDVALYLKDKFKDIGEVTVHIEPADD